MATPLAICNQTGKPIPPGEAPQHKWLDCWFCKNARVRRRVSVKGVVHYTTYRGDEHTHPVCASVRTDNKYLEFEGIRDTFHAAMANTSISESDSKTAELGGHLPPNSEEEKIEKLTSLSRLVKWGLFECPDFRLNNYDQLSSIILNSKIAPDYFSAGPDKHLGFRAIVVRTDALDEDLMWFRFILDYKLDSENVKKNMYFYLFTTSRQIFNETRDKLFMRSEISNSYVPKDDLTVLIYGEWNAYGCNRCKVRRRKHLGSKISKSSTYRLFERSAHH